MLVCEITDVYLVDQARCKHLHTDKSGGISADFLAKSTMLYYMTDHVDANPDRGRS